MDVRPLFLSIKTAFMATIFTFILGILAARLVLKTGKYKGVLDGLFTLSMVLPPTVVGFFLLVFLGNNGPLSYFYNLFNFKIIFTYPAAVIASVVVSFPLMYRTSLGAFEQIDINYIYAARTLGFSERKIFLKIILPMAKPGLLSGVVLAFARALGEFGATIMIAGNIEGRTQTVSTAIYTAVQAGKRDIAFRWSLIISLFSLIAMILMNYLSTEKRQK
ncbi:MAG: molybdate ABC transporter permease subunit [Tissierellia bacterium]|nr:molybdate ABC transporter permease subunit [Tissierellia bacterium]